MVPSTIIISKKRSQKTPFLEASGPQSRTGHLAMRLGFEDSKTHLAGGKEPSNKLETGGDVIEQGCN